MYHLTFLYLTDIYSQNIWFSKNISLCPDVHPQLPLMEHLWVTVSLQSTQGNKNCSCLFQCLSIGISLNSLCLIFLKLNTRTGCIYQ